MKLNVALELKDSIKARVLQIAKSSVPSLAAFAAGRGSLMPAGMPRNLRTRTGTAAVGVSPVPGKAEDFRLALRVSGRLQAADLLAEMSLSEREVDIVEGIQFFPRASIRPAEAAGAERIPRPAGEVYPGGSCGHFNVTAGTLGGFVEDDDRYYILSNNHVLADSDKGLRGDPIIEPGLIDIVGNAYRVVGTLERWVPLGGGTIDAALAILDPAIKWFHPWTYKGIGHMNPAVITDRFAVRRVTKLGRTTGVTKGVVSAFALDGVTINYGSETRPYVIEFDDQIEFVGNPPQGPFSLPGDSGSFILDADTLRPYALLFAGGAGVDGIDRTIASFMPDVLAQLNVRMITS
jgi:hypothetical protein